MKKLVLLFLFLTASKVFAAESAYKINDESIDLLFSEAQELSLSHENVVSLIPSSSVAAKNKVAAGLLGIFCGGLGIHRFYLGHTKAGFIYLGWALCSGGIITGISIATLGAGAILYPLVYAPGVVGFVDGILYLIGEDGEFESKYVNNQKLIQWIK